MLESGYIRLYRGLLNWEWYDDVNTKVLFLHLLLTVNYEDRSWHGIEIGKGQRVCSIATLSAETKLSVKAVRTALNHLKKTNEVTSRKVLECTLYEVVNFSKYQTGANETASEGQAEGKARANEGQGMGKVGANEGQQCNKAKKANKANKANKAKNTRDTPYPLPDNFSEKLATAVSGWLKYKAERNESYKPQGMTMFLNKVTAMADFHGDDAVIDAMETAQAANWKGIVWDSLSRQQNSKKQSSNPFLDMLREEERRNEQR